MTARAETFKFFGSAGAEWQLTPANAGSVLNPRNIAGLPYRTSSGDAVAFVDAAPDSRTWKLHLKLHGDAEEGGSQSADIGEAFIQLNPKPWLDVTIGRVIEKWGTGYAWNPTAFVSPKKNPADPSDRRSANVGVDMIRTDLFVRGTNVSLYALDDGAFAGRVYRLIGGTDVSLHSVATLTESSKASAPRASSAMRSKCTAKSRGGMHSSEVSTHFAATSTSWPSCTTAAMASTKTRSARSSAPPISRTTSAPSAP
jgi:hypothetical protein